MKKLLFFTFLISIYTQRTQSQVSGTLNGSFTSTSTPSTSTNSFIASGNGQYEITGTYTSTNNVPLGITAYIGTPEDYNIGSDLDQNSTISFTTDCVETNQIINLLFAGLGMINYTYTVTYTFIPTTYNNEENEPNDTYNDAITTVENTNYEGWFNNSNKPDNVDNTDWYKFVSPRNGELVITIKDGDEFGDNATVSLFDNSSNEITATDVSQSGLTTTYKYSSFNNNGDQFGIKLESNCVSYQFSWTVNESLSVNTFNLSNSIGLYPNPSSNRIKINTKNNITIEKTEIYDLTGKLINNNSYGIRNDFITIKNLNCGVYILKFITNKGTITKKIIKS